MSDADLRELERSAREGGELELARYQRALERVRPPTDTNLSRPRDGLPRAHESPRWFRWTTNLSNDPPEQTRRIERNGNRAERKRKRKGR